MAAIASIMHDMMTEALSSNLDQCSSTVNFMRGSIELSNPCHGKRLMPVF